MSLKIASASLPVGVRSRPSPIASIARWVPDEVNRRLWDPVAPEEADYIVVPFVCRTRDASPQRPAQAMRELLNLLPLWQPFPEKHILLDNSDFEQPYAFLTSSYLFKTSASYRFQQVRPLPYLHQGRVDVSPIETAVHDLAFVGCWKTHPIRKALEVQTRLWKHLSIDFELTDKPFFSLPTDQRHHLEQRFREQMQSSRFILCPRGRGLNSRRFYETLAYGRIPVLIADAARLPLESQIDYDQFIVRVPEGMISHTPEYVEAFLQTQTLAEASRQARQCFVSYFAPDQFRHFLEQSLQI